VSDDDTKLLRFTSLRWPRIITKQTSVTTAAYKCCLSIQPRPQGKVLGNEIVEHFYKKNASYHNHTSQMFFFFVFFFSVFLLLLICACHWSIRQVENLLISLRALLESSKMCYFLSVFTPLLLTMFSVTHIYRWQIARLHFVSLIHRECFILGQFFQNLI